MTQIIEHARGEQPNEEPQSVELSLQELLLFAMRLHRDSKLDAAEKCYRSALQVEPDNANALHYLGVLLHQRRQFSEAIELIQRSIAMDPEVAAWQNNFGNVLLEESRYGEAAAAYARCSELDENNLEVLNNLGVLLRKLNRQDEAEESFKRAVARDPAFGDAHANLATLYTLQKRFPEAFSHFADALALKPRSIDVRRLLVMAYGKAGRLEEAREVCQEWLTLDPDDARAAHFLAAYGVVDVPERASDQYVITEFDGFANSFDARLASLEYRAPQWVGDAVAGLLGEPAKECIILDAGCGTGLCAHYLRPYAKWLGGVDLSANMLIRARDRGLYDELMQSELVHCLQTGTGGFDVVVSADTLCYFGRLTDAFVAVRQALRPGGYWVFTVEAHTLDADYKLQLHGRYSHSKSYIESELVKAGFQNTHLKTVNLRFENGEPVAGWLASAW